MSKFFAFGKPGRVSALLLLLLVGTIGFAGCAYNQAAVASRPVVDRGRVVFKVKHLFFSYNVDYSVGCLDNGSGMAVVGEIENTTTSKLENFKLELEIKDEKGRVLAAVATDSFPVDPDAGSLFTFHVPTLEDRVLFSFRCQFEYRQKSRGGYAAAVRDQNHFQDWIDFSAAAKVKNPANAQTKEYIEGEIGD